MGGELTRVRIFQAGEFAAPSGWPEDVGIAVISAGDGPEVFPVHSRETGAEVLLRLSALSGHDLHMAAVHPAVAGHPVCELPFSAVADLLAGVEDFLARFPDAVDEADDFAVNFGFAVDEGIAFPALLQTDPSTLPETTPPPAPVLAGYSVYQGPTPTFRPFLRIGVTGDLIVVPDPDQPVLTAITPEVMVRDDGLGLAVSLDVAVAPDGAMRALRLPAGCLPWLPRDSAQDVPLLAVTRGGYLLLSPLPDLAGQAPPASLPEPDTESPLAWLDGLRAALGGHWRRRVMGAATVSTLLIAAVWLGGGHQPDSKPVSSVESLRAGLFD